ncbi:MAG: hypothetical protein OXG79_12725 [Chloroflexi bacterium]|nr:hypothetical protein [Chloroflexota bacterium]
MNIVFDLDGTLADTAHRIHFLEQDPKDWDAFFAQATYDIPIQATRRLFRTLMQVKGFGNLAIWTARPERCRADTVCWLRRHDLWLPDMYGRIPEEDVLRMRPDDDRRHDTVLKAQWLEESPWKPDLVFEDRTRMVDLWRSQGITCYQVAPGDF